MVDIGFPEEKEYAPFYIGMEVKPMYSFVRVDFFCFERPVTYGIDHITDVVYYDRYECADHDTSEEEYDKKYNCESEPSRYTVFFSEIYEWIYHDRKEESNDNDKYDISESVEKVTEKTYSEKYEDFFGPKREFLIHKKKIILSIIKKSPILQWKILFFEFFDLLPKKIYHMIEKFFEYKSLRFTHFYFFHSIFP